MAIIVGPQNQDQGSKASLAWGGTYGRSCTRGTSNGWPEATSCSCYVRGRPEVSRVQNPFLIPL